MDSPKLLMPRFISHNKRVTHYCSESQLLFKSRSKKTLKISSRIKNLKKRTKNFLPYQQEAKNSYAKHVDLLLRQYHESFDVCKTKMNLVDLLNGFDFNMLKGDKYRLICRYLIPFIMALNDSDFDHQAKIDGLVLFQQKYAPMLAKKSRFVFTPLVIEFNDAYNFLKLIVVYNFCLMSGSDEYLNQLKNCNPTINFDQLNTIQAIVNFDCIKHKKIELLEQKDPNYQVPRIDLLLSQDLAKIICIAQMKAMFSRSSFLFCYYDYKKLMKSFEKKPEKTRLLQDFFWGVYLKEAFLNSLVWLLAMITKPFDCIASRFDQFINTSFFGSNQNKTYYYPHDEYD